MPIKTVVCAICKEIVNKSQTLAIDDIGNRACRYHEDVETKSKNLVDQQKRKLQNSIIKKQEPKYKHKEMDLKEAMTLRCWRCYKEGVHADEMILRQLIEMEKLEIMGSEDNFLELNLKSAQSAQKHFGDKVTILMFETDFSKIKMLDKRYRMTAELSRIMAICPKCCEEMKIDWKEKFKINPKLDELDVATLSILGDSVKKVIKPIAAAELSRNN